MKRFLIIILTQLTIVQYGFAFKTKNLLLKSEYCKSIYSDSTKNSKEDPTIVSDSTKVDVNFLKAPSSPAANLLGFSPSEVQSPSDPAAFIAHFQAPSNNFTTLPKSFAVDIAPFWFFGAKRRTFTEYICDKPKYNILQSSVLSIAYRDSSNTLKGYKGNSFLSFGGKISIFRGKPKKLNEFYKKLNGEANRLLTFIKDTLDTDPELVKRRKSSKTIRDEMKTLLAQGSDLKNLPQQLLHLDSLVSNLENSLKHYAVGVFNSQLESLQKKSGEQKKQFTNEIVREGFKWDIAGGYSYRYNQNNVDSSKVFKSGVWTTFGYEKTDSLGMGHWSFLSMARYLTNPEQPWADEKGILKGKTGISTFDLGIKIAYLRQGHHTISASTEVLYRSIVSKQDEKSKIEPSWRLAFNANYEVSKNLVLTLAIGRDFDGAISKNGNVFAFLNLITAFGEGANVKK